MHFFILYENLIKKNIFFLMDDIFNNVISNCPWVENNFVNWFWSRFGLSLFFLHFVMYGISIWDKDIYIFILSIGLSVNSLIIWGFHVFFSVSSPFPGCGEQFGLPSNFSQQISFFYITYFGCLVHKDAQINSYRLHVISVWTTFTLYSLLYFPINTHFQILLGCLLGTFSGLIFLLLSFFVLFPNAHFLIELKHKIKNFI